MSSTKRSTWLVFCLLGAACGDDAAALYVDLVTDVVAGVEFSSVRVELDDRQQTIEVSLGDNFERGLRVADFGDLAPGTRSGRLVMEGPDGDRVVARPFEVELRAGQQTATFVVSRGCLVTTCPTAADSTATACLADRCVDPRCSRETPEFCPTAACSAASDCAAAAMCSEATCVDGVCLYSERAGGCEAGSYCDPATGCQTIDMSTDAGPGDAGSDAGTVDASGMDTCECTPGTEMISACGRGCARGIQTCGVDCRWGAVECEEPVGAASCWLWRSPGALWDSYPEPVGVPNAPTSVVLAAFDVEAANEAYLLTSSSYHVLQLSDRRWIASGSLATLLPGLDGTVRYAVSLPATFMPSGRERVEITTSTQNVFYFDHVNGSRRFTAAVPRSARCCDGAQWGDPAAPAFESIQAAWFDGTNGRGLYNEAGDPLCPAAAGHEGPIAFANYLASPLLHQLESQLCFEFAPSFVAEDDDPIGGLRVGGSGPDPRAEAIGAAFYRESESVLWVITP